MSLIFFPMSIGFISHVDFKKRQCRPVDFRGQGPLPTLPPGGKNRDLFNARTPVVINKTISSYFYIT